MKILLVEDDKRQYESFKIVLKELKSKDPLHLSWASKDYEAISLTEEDSFDLVFMDIGLQDSKMDGIALTHYFRQELNKDWPIVVFSVSRLGSDKERALEAGADHYLPKPYGYMEMLISLGELITEVGKGRRLINNLISFMEISPLFSGL